MIPIERIGRSMTKTAPVLKALGPIDREFVCNDDSGRGQGAFE